MRPILATLALLLLATGIRAEPRFPQGTSSHPATEERAAFTIHIPKVRALKDVPLLVALHEMGVSDKELAARLAPFAARARYILLCPRAQALSFRDVDLPRVIGAIREVTAELPLGDVHLFGIAGGGYQALRFAFEKPREFRTAVSLGADAPRVRPKSGANSLRVLLMKGTGDRPAAGRESLEAVSKELELAEFREVPGSGLKFDSPTQSYVQYFLDAASGRQIEGPDRNLDWRDPARGIAERNRRKVPALIYLADDSPEYAARTEKIRVKAFMDPKLRKAADGLVPILAPRPEGDKLVPGARLAPGPAVAVLDAEGKLAGVLQRKVTAGAILALLKAR